MQLLEQPLMEWIQNITKEGLLPSSCQAILIGLYEGDDGYYHIYFSGSSSFDKNDDDWACLTDNDYAPKNRYFYTKIPTTENWESFQNMVINEIKKVIANEETILNQTDNIA